MLYDAMQTTLRDAVGRAADLDAGELKAEKKANLRVHGRTGLPCPVCGDTVREVSFADSSLQYCPTCQTGGKPLADRRLLAPAEVVAAGRCARGSLVRRLKELGHFRARTPPNSFTRRRAGGVRRSERRHWAKWLNTTPSGPHAGARWPRQQG